jgi:hypothetical protein
MRDTAADLQKVIEQLESSWAIATELNEPALAYLIECAILKAKERSSFRPPKGK